MCQLSNPICASQNAQKLLFCIYKQYLTCILQKQKDLCHFRLTGLENVIRTWDKGKKTTTKKTMYFSHLWLEVKIPSEQQFALLKEETDAQRCNANTWEAQTWPGLDLHVPSSAVWPLGFLQFVLLTLTTLQTGHLKHEVKLQFFFW